MAYDEDLAHRIRELLVEVDGVREQKLFGGLGFMVGGNMAVAASGKGGLMVRVDPAETAKLVTREHVSRMVMGGREMDGWLRVADEGCRTKRQLQPWVTRGVAFASALPPK